MKDKIIMLFELNKIRLTDCQAEMFEKYLKLLKSWNKKFNLTAIVEDEDIIVKHFIDSVLPYKTINENSRVIDIGAGAGFPGIPLKILKNNIKLTLVDSVLKKTFFLKEVVEQLKITDVKIIHSRCENLANMKDFRESFDYVVARALSPLNILIEYCIPFLKCDALLLAYKGEGFNKEVACSKNALNKLSSKIFKTESYTLAPLNVNRYVVFVKKCLKTNKQYPRSMNKPRTHQL